MRTTLAVTLLLVLAAVAAPALARNHAPGRHDAAHRAAAMDEQHFMNLSENARERGLARAEAGGHFGRLNYTGGAGAGRFVSFLLDEDSGTVSDYAVRAGNGTTTFLDEVSIKSFDANGSARVHGSVLRLRGNDSGLAIHNNPLALLRVHAGGAGANLTVTLASGVNATRNGSEVTLVAGGLHAHLLATGNGTVSGNGTYDVTLEPGGTLLFMAHRGDAPANLHAMKDAMRSGRLGAVASIVDADGAPLQDNVFLGVNAHAKDVARGRANVTLSSDDPAGKVVVLHLDRAILDPANASRVDVTLDGRPVTPASDAGAVLNGSGPSTASFFAVAAPSGVQVIVNVPGFSDHELSITSGGPAPTGGAGTTTTPPTGTTTGTTTSTPPADGNDSPGPASAVVLVGLAGAALALRRRA